MKKLFLLIALLSCNAVWGQPVPDRLFDQNISSLANKLIILAQNEVEFLDLIRHEAGKRFDGEYNCLLAPLLDYQFDNRQSLAQKLEQMGPDGIQLVAFIQDHPRLQIAVPVHWDQWVPRTVLPIVWVPGSYNESTSTSIPCFLPNGQTVELILDTAPAYPVWVLGLNERTDKNGNLIPGQRATDSPPPIDDGDDDWDDWNNGGGDDDPPCYGLDGGWQYLESIYCIDLNIIEHWIAGSPEIQFIFKSADNNSLLNGEWGVIIEPPNRSDINETWYLANATLFRWYYDENGGANDVGFSCLVFVNERDNGQIIDMPISLSMTTPEGLAISLDFTVSITDNDEIIGSLPAYFIDCNHFTYNPGTVRFKMYRE